MSLALAHSAVGPTDGPVALVLHGILGSQSNWRSVARSLSAATGWRLVLVDLRNHGESHPASPPHTVDACADDLLRLAGTLSRPPQAVIGHSFGGKVALAYGERAAQQTAVPPPDRVWVLDALPGPGRGDPNTTDVAKVVAALQAMPVPIQSREALVTDLTSAGFSRMLARWMTTNLRRQGDGFAWKFDLDAVVEMLRDYWQRDLWPWLESPWRHTEVHLVRAGRSDRWTDDVLNRIHAVAASAPVDLCLHTLPDAGHWLHVDDPAGLQEILVRAGIGGAQS